MEARCKVLRVAGLIKQRSRSNRSLSPVQLTSGGHRPRAHALAWLGGENADRGAERQASLRKVFETFPITLPDTGLRGPPFLLFPTTSGRVR
ncbi:MAG: hypothetical protein ACJAZN_002408 [Planctomycetota bacterium]|jgi:hypothetical protein